MTVPDVRSDSVRYLGATLLDQRRASRTRYIDRVGTSGVALHEQIAQNARQDPQVVAEGVAQQGQHY